jgi:hypothetical protein
MTLRPNQIVGAVLEEAILAVIGIAGFVPVENLDSDSCINPHKPPVTIRGRGTDHQIDVVADPVVGYAFSHPARLLIEAKAYAENRRVGLDVVRNAVGTLKDVSEFWRPPDAGLVGAKRYHYRYAIFATTTFTKGAQEYAFAQDVYLLPLRRSAFFRPVVQAIDELRRFYGRLPGLRDGDGGFALDEYRLRVRETFREQVVPDDLEELEDIVRAVRSIKHGLIAVAGRQFPLFLVPKTPEVLDQLRDVEKVEIYWDEDSWYLKSPESADCFFSFDLPDELFNLYVPGLRLEPSQAIRLKAEQLAVMQALIFKESKVRIVQFKLDSDWIEKLQSRGSQG